METFSPQKIRDVKLQNKEKLKSNYLHLLIKNKMYNIIKQLGLYLFQK